MADRIEVDGKVVPGVPESLYSGDSNALSLYFEVSFHGIQYPPPYLFSDLHKREVRVFFGSMEYNGPTIVRSLNFGKDIEAKASFEIVPPMTIRRIDNADQGEE